MKQMKILLVLMSVMLLTVSCDDEKIITAEQLPAPAQAIIEKQFAGLTPLVVKKETEWLFWTKYKVTFDNGQEAEFDSDGVMTDFDND